MVDDFNRYLDGVGVMSTFVRDVLRDCGVDVPIRVVGNGVDIPDPAATVEAPELVDLRGFTFLHISSAFPRKGVDVLLESYFAAFDGQSDVSLILKTFPNPHNQVGEILDRLRAGHPNPPDVRWIDRDLDDRELEALYGLADCYVHPARGEGFGLPVAEAMAAGVPVISLAYSGLADFVSEETAVTIPFTLEPAQTHLDLDHSIWAEPDGESLTVELKRMAEHPDDPAVRRRVDAARQLITTRFSWAAAVGRWEEFIADLEDTAGVQQVAMVTTWNSRCGIAENTRYIVEHSRHVFDFDLFADVDAEVIDPGGRSRCEPDLEGPMVARPVDARGGAQADGRRGGPRPVQLRVLRVPAHGRPHRTPAGDPRGRGRDPPPHPRLRRPGRAAESPPDRRHAGEGGPADRAPGIRRPLPGRDRVAGERDRGAHRRRRPARSVSPSEVRAALELGSRPVVGTFGFLLPHKGTLELVKALDPLRAEFPDLLLVALCARYPHVESKEYEDQIRAEIAARGMEDSVLLVTEYLADEVARTLLRGADVIVLPYQETGESSSAALRFILPLGRPVVVTDAPIFSDSRDALLVVDGDATSIEDGVRQGAHGHRSRGATWPIVPPVAARRFRWPRVVADHQEIYTAARRAGRARSLLRSPVRMSS